MCYFIPDFDLLPHIHILLRFDEDLGDEWFVVFLVMNLTKKFEGLIARMVDSDGEFLLIEAAEELPVWATPETCQNRVFIMNGAVHVVQDKQKIYINILNSVYQRSHIFKMSDKVCMDFHIVFFWHNFEFVIFYWFYQFYCRFKQSFRRELVYIQKRQRGESTKQELTCLKKLLIFSEENPDSLPRH